MRKGRLSQRKLNKLIALFVAGVTERTVAHYFHRLRLLIYQNSPHLEMFDGETEADVSHLVGTRKSKCGRGANPQRYYR